MVKMTKNHKRVNKNHKFICKLVNGPNKIDNLQKITTPAKKKAKDLAIFPTFSLRPAFQPLN